MSKQFAYWYRNTTRPRKLCILAIVLWSLLSLPWIRAGYFNEVFGGSEADTVREVFRQQLRVLFETQAWRNLPDVPYAGYVGPWLEDLYYTRWLQRDAGDREQLVVYLPIFWTKCHKHCTSVSKQELRSYLNKLDRRYTYYTVVAIGRGLSHPQLNIVFPDDLKVIVYSAGGCTSGKSVKNVIVPLVKDVPPLQNIPKTKTVSFIGKYQTHPMREVLRNLYSKSWTFSNSSPGWAKFTESSHFTLCPRGYGPTSFRIMEAIHLNSIPIYVWEGELMLPWRDIIPWDRMAVVVHYSKIREIPQLVAQFDRQEALMLLQKYKNVFTLNTTCTMVQKHVQQVDYEGIQDQCASFEI